MLLSFPWQLHWYTMLLACDLDRQAIGFTYSWINTTLCYYHYACILLVVQSLSIVIHGALLSRKWKKVAKLVIQHIHKYLGLENYKDMQYRWQTIAVNCSNNISFFQENKDYARINSVLSWFIALILLKDTLPKTRNNNTVRPKQLTSTNVSHSMVGM